MTLEELIRHLKKIGADYPKKGDHFFRNNQPAAVSLTKICNIQGKFQEEIVQQQLLMELQQIFSDVKKSSVLSREVRDALIQYDPFKNFDKYWGGTSKQQPTAKDMVKGLDSLGAFLHRQHNLAKEIAIASKVELKP